MKMTKKNARAWIVALSLVSLAGLSAGCSGESDVPTVHLGASMNELQRRFGALWFAGQAGDTATIKYQSIEIGEVVENLRAANYHEGSVNVVARLELHVLDRLDALAEASAQGDKETFKKTYELILAGCNGCHVETNHTFIRVKFPEYNPYPCLEYGPN